MWSFSSVCDEFCVSTRVFFKLELAPTRESLLNFCEHVRRAFPTLNRFRRRDDGGIILDEDEGRQADRRYLRLDPDALRFGHVCPPNRAAVIRFARLILEHAPAYLSLSELDYENIELTCGFDLEYAGNHDELVAETLLGDSPLQTALLVNNSRIIDCQPCMGVAIGNDCDTQAYLEIRGRTSMAELRSGEYEPQFLSVNLTVRRIFRTAAPRELTAIHQHLLEIAEELALHRVVPLIVRPLREAIATRR